MDASSRLLPEGAAQPPRRRGGNGTDFPRSCRSAPIPEGSL